MRFFGDHFRSALLASTALTFAVATVPTIAYAAVVTYDGTNAPGATTSTGNFNLGTNWDAGTAPTATDTANFDQSANIAPKTTAITFSNPSTTVGAITFTNNPAYSFNFGSGQTLTVNGILTNNSMAAETFNLGTSGLLMLGSLSNTSSGGETFNSGMGNVTINGSAAIGSSTVVYTGSGTTITGAYTSTGGTLDISGITTGGSTIGSISDTSGGAEKIKLGTGDLFIDGISSTTYDGVISGSGEVISEGNTLTLTGANTYSGGLQINAGSSLVLGNAAASGTGPVNLGGTGATLNLNTSATVYGLSGFDADTVNTSNHTLTIDNTTNQAFSGTITGTGNLIKTGPNIQILVGTENFNNTSILQGNLMVGATDSSTTLTSSIDIATAGTLSGRGTVIGNVTNSGTLQPAGQPYGLSYPDISVGMMSIHGNYNQSSAGTLTIKLNPTMSSSLAITGTANIAGTLTLIPESGNYVVGTQYTILTSTGGISGAFGTVTNNSTIPFSVTYFPTEINITAGLSGTTFHIDNLTPNEANVTNVIESIFATSVNSNSTIFNQNLVSIATAPAFSQGPQLAGILGEARADGATIALGNLTSFQSFLVDRMDRRQGLTDGAEINSGLPGTFDVAMNDSDMPLFGPRGAIDAEQPQFWARGYGVFGTAGGETGFAETQYRTGGIIGGADVKIGDGALLGAAVAYEHTDLNLSGDMDENNIDTYRITLYGSQKLDPVPLVLDGALGYAYNDYHNNDFLPLAGGGGFSQTSRHDGNELTADAGLSQRYAIAQDEIGGALTLVPRVGIEYDNISQSAYATSGAPDPTVNFLTNSATLNALRSTIGGKADLKLVTSDGTVVTPELRASYLHDFMDTNVTLTEAFAGAPTAGFRISGVHPGRDAALVGTGVTVGFSENISATIGYDAAIRQNELDHTVEAGIKYTW